MDSPNQESSDQVSSGNHVAGFSDTIAYHLGELETAKDKTNPRHLMPEFKSYHRVILDIGCGIGQTFIAAGLVEEKDRTLVGLDIEIEPLQFGHAHTPSIQFLLGDGSCLPIRSGCIDLVVSRVTLPYTNIPAAIAELQRVLKPGGEIWITLHSAKVLFNPLVRYFRVLGIKGFLVRLFFLFNGVLLHVVGILLPHPKSGVYESFQTNRGIRRLLKKHKFVAVEISRGTHFLVTARKSDA